MVRRILLLTTESSFGDCAQFLQKCNPSLEIAGAYDLTGLRHGIRGREQETRLIAFLTGVIVPADILDKLGPTPYNIHPGPPEYPGSYPEAFAIWEKAEFFGVTGHEIKASVDSGPIVYVERFPMVDLPNLQGLVDQLYPVAVEAFSKIAFHCANSDADLPHLAERWGQKKGTRRAFRELYRSASNLCIEDYDRLKRACGSELVENNVKTA